MEVEVKLNVNPDIPGGPVGLYSRLLRLESLSGYRLGPVDRHLLRDLYYDTPDRRLAAIGAGLRLRVVDGRSLVTLKLNRRLHGALTHRDELEEVLTQQSLDWVLTHVREAVGPGPHPWKRFAAGEPCGGLSPVLDVQTGRLTRAVGEVAHLFLDRVEYPGVSSTEHFDLEVESVAGALHVPELRRLEAALSALGGGHLQPASESKLERGIRLKTAR